MKDNTRKDTTNKDIREDPIKDNTREDTRKGGRDLYYPMTFNKY